MSFSPPPTLPQRTMWTPSSLPPRRKSISPWPSWLLASSWPGRDDKEGPGGAGGGEGGQREEPRGRRVGTTTTEPIPVSSRNASLSSFFPHSRCLVVLTFYSSKIFMSLHIETRKEALAVLITLPSSLSLPLPCLRPPWSVWRRGGEQGAFATTRTWS